MIPSWKQWGEMQESEKQVEEEILFHWHNSFMLWEDTGVIPAYICFISCYRK